MPHNYYVVASPDPVPANALFTTDVNAQKDNNLRDYLSSYITEVTAMEIYNYLSTLNLNFGIGITVFVGLCSSGIRMAGQRQRKASGAAQLFPMISGIL